MKKRNHNLNVENLETRQMMAGDVAAFVSGGNLFINEAAGQAGQANGVFITQLANGKIRVSGDFTPDDTGVSKVNGREFQDFTVTGNLVVKLGAGNDGIAFGGSISPTFNDVSIDVGAPPPVIAKAVTSAFGGVGTVFSPPDNDQVDVESIRTRGSMSISTGGGSDAVFMSKFNIGSAPNGHNGDLTINTGAGADTVFLQTSAGSTISNVFGKVNIQTFSNVNENNYDDVNIQTMLALGDVTVQTGGGADIVNLTGVVSNKKIDLNLGTHDDTVVLRRVQSVDGLFARMGEGNDNLFADTIWGNATLLGEGGTDTLTTTNLHGTTNTVNGWEWVNGRRIFTDVVSPTLGSNATMFLAR